ncbi:MAG: SLBB domain protein [Chlorobi bacterium OLB5]|nr:MAG: SLBB domain protein [Chlorobi bacterium OLB5]
MKYIASVVFFLLFAAISYSQIDSNLILGLSTKSNSAALYDLSDPTGVNMEVNLWGYVRYPGRYRIPVNTTFMDIISFAGGPTDESNLEEIRIIRNANDQTKKPSLIKLNYEDVLWEDNISGQPKLNPVLQPGDVIVIMKEKRYTFKEELSIYIPVLTSLISIATFIITLSNN